MSAFRRLFRALFGIPEARPEIPPTEILDFLSDRFPPMRPFPNLDLCRRSASFLRVTASGAPGDTVEPGLFPRPREKNARLLLAYAGLYDSSSVLDRARRAYGNDRTQFARPKSYHAHDAVACALVHPSIDPSLKCTLIAHLCAETSRTRGHRSRKKTWRLRRWAIERGLVTEREVTR